MALNKPQLKNAIQTALETSKNEGWSLDQVATALSDAIDAYVRGAKVKSVVINLDDGRQIGERPLE
jgi:hypothetical protein